MFTPSFTIAQDGQIINNVTIKEEAVNVAKTRAAETGKDVTITAHLDAVTDRDVVFHPDGTNEKIWIIDKGQSMEPVIGQVYTNRGGGRFRCIAPATAGPTFYNAAGGSSNASGVFQNVESGWTFTAKGIIQYIDGTIEWDHSTDGRFEKVTKASEESAELKPEIGRVYANRNGQTYRCLWSSDTGATFINDENGQTFQATGIIQHTDGTIEWARSNEEVTA